ncbi:hypothetical protein [uncultured Acidaminococcus sp.]|jgi:hypothetical protein|nr:hypothetical protein [uncultured Acidaminococcus sp.]
MAVNALSGECLERPCFDGPASITAVAVGSQIMLRWPLSLEGY